MLEVGEAAFVGVMSPVVIILQPVGLTHVPPDQSASFSVTVTSTGPIHYQWRLNGNFISGATNSTYNIAAVGPGDAGSYSVAVGNLVGDINSAEAPLTLNVPPFPLNCALAPRPPPLKVSHDFYD